MFLFLAFFLLVAKTFFQVYFLSQQQTPHHRKANLLLLHAAVAQFIFRAYQTAAEKHNLAEMSQCASFLFADQ